MPKRSGRVLALAYIYVSLNILILLMGISFFAAGGEFGTGLGIALIASGVTGLLLSLYHMADRFWSEQVSQSVEAAGELGLIEVLDRRPLWRISETPAFLRATEIDILEISGYTLTFPNIKEDWSSCRARKIRVLLLDPVFPGKDDGFAAHRDAAEHRAGSYEILIEVRDFIRKFGAGAPEERFEVRLTQAMPTLSYFRMDNNAYWAPLVFGVNGDATPHMLVNDTGIIFEVLKRSFEEMWEESVPPPGNL